MSLIVGKSENRKISIFAKTFLDGPGWFLASPGVQGTILTGSKVVTNAGAAAFESSLGLLGLVDRHTDSPAALLRLRLSGTRCRLRMPKW